MEGAKHPLPVVRIGERAVRFDPDKISTYIRSRERHSPSASLSSFDGIVRANRKRRHTLARKRFQTGTVRLRTDRGPADWQGPYLARIVDGAGGAKRQARVLSPWVLEEIAKQESPRSEERINAT